MHQRTYYARALLYTGEGRVLAIHIKHVARMSMFERMSLTDSIRSTALAF